LIQWGDRQIALLRPYVERWIEEVPRFWALRSSEEAESFTEFLYPRELVEPGTLDAADRALAAIRDSTELSESTRRAASRPIIEGRDGTERAMRARACDTAASRR
jgi:aminopeptidase N